MFKKYQLVKHSKGGVYIIINTPDEVMIEFTRDPAYVYAPVNGGMLYVRSAVAMEDGRFRLIGEVK